MQKEGRMLVRLHMSVTIPIYGSFHTLVDPSHIPITSIRITILLKRDPLFAEVHYPFQCPQRTSKLRVHLHDKEILVKAAWMCRILCNDTNKKMNKK